MEEMYRLPEREVRPAFGCTEPIALAFTAAKAVEVLGTFPDQLEAACSGNIIKNAKSVTIPNSEGRKGLYYSLILGAIVGNADKELEVLNALTHDDVIRADELAHADFCKVSLAEGVENLYIAVTVTGGGHTVMVRVERMHTNITRIEKDGEVIFDAPCEAVTAEDVMAKFEDCYQFAETADFTRLKDLLGKQFDYNMAIAEEGLRGNYGANIGSVLLDMEGNDVRVRAKAYAAAGSDARMNGCEQPVVINSGSGNQGITTSVPVIVYAQELGVSDEKLLRALTLSNLTTIHEKTPIGRLSAYCGAISAGAGAGAGIAYLCGGDYDAVIHTVVNALAVVSGVICDGAKASCAAKIATAVEAGLLGYNMYIRGNQFRAGDGIVAKGVENSLKNVGRLGKQGMKETNNEIIAIMVGC